MQQDKEQWRLQAGVHGRRFAGTRPKPGKERYRSLSMKPEKEHCVFNAVCSKAHEQTKGRMDGKTLEKEGEDTVGKRTGGERVQVPEQPFTCCFPIWAGGQSSKDLVTPVCKLLQSALG